MKLIEISYLIIIKLHPKNKPGMKNNRIFFDYQLKPEEKKPAWFDAGQRSEVIEIRVCVTVAWEPGPFWRTFPDFP